MVRDPGESRGGIEDLTPLANRQQESLNVYTDGFRAYEPLEDDDVFMSECVVHSDGEMLILGFT